MKKFVGITILALVIIIFVIVVVSLVRPPDSAIIDLKNYAFPGKLVFSGYEYGQGSTEWRVQQMTSGQEPVLMWKSPQVSFGAVYPIFFSPGLSYAIDQNEIFDLSTGQSIGTLDFQGAVDRSIASSLDDKYVAYISGATLKMTQVRSGATTELASSPCRGYDYTSNSTTPDISGNDCLWFGSLAWLDQSNLLFLNDKAMLTGTYEFPPLAETLWVFQGAAGYQGVSFSSSGQGNEVSSFEVDGKVQFLSDDSELMNFLSALGLQNHGDVLINPASGVWISKQALRQGEYTTHTLPPYATNGSPYYELARALSPQGHYFLRFPFDIVDLQTGQTNDLHLFFAGNSMPTSLTTFDLLGNGIEFNDGHERKSYGVQNASCVWYADEQEAACGLTLITPEDSQQTTFLLVFVSPSGENSTITEYIQRPSSYMFLEAWLP